LVKITERVKNRKKRGRNAYLNKKNRGDTSGTVAVFGMTTREPSSWGEKKGRVGANAPKTASRLQKAK